jgi:hypothetical protein
VKPAPDADTVLVFRVGSVSLSNRRKGGPCSLLNAARHLSREIQAEIGADKRIDPSRSHLNLWLHGPRTGAETVQLAAAAAVGAGVDVSCLKRDYCQAIELMFGLPATAAVDSAQYFGRCLDWAMQALPGVVLLCAVVHHDEDNPHMHVLLSPFKAGASIAKDVKASKSVRRLIESFFANVAGPAGLKRGGAKLHGRAKEAAVEVVLQRLAREGVEASAAWASIRASVERDPMPYLSSYGIDVGQLREAVLARPIALRLEGSGPIALASTLPAPVDNSPQNDEGLSCVAPVNQQPLHISTDTYASTAAGRSKRPVTTAPATAHPEVNPRMNVALKEQEAAIRRHVGKPTARPVLVPDADGYTRERDESFDPSIWERSMVVTAHLPKPVNDGLLRS